jgi:hypothetical protein
MNKKLFLALALLFCFTTTGACQKQRRPCRYLIADGYVGWVKVYFKVKKAPPLPIEDGYYLFAFPASGVLLTSSDLEEGWARDQYFYYAGTTRHPLASTGWDGGGVIWAEYTGQGGDVPPGASSVYEGMFVGTEAEYKDYGRYVNDSEPGPLDRKAIEAKKKRDGIQ